MQILDRQWLARCAADSGTARDYLGCQLARWLLTPAARRRERLEPPIPPDRHGSVTPIIVLHRDLCAQGVLARACALPMQWRRQATDSPQLPGDMRAQAAAARGALDIQDWGLDLPEELVGLDLSALRFDARSAWATLAAGLYVAAHGGQPRREIFATGAWAGKGIESVRDIPAKLRAVRDLGLAGTQLFVPAANHEPARAAAESDLRIHPYPFGDRDPLRSLREHLAILAAPPPVLADNLQARAEYANRYLPRGPARQRYYMHALVDGLAKRLAASLQGQVPVNRLTLNVGRNWELCVLLCKAFSPRRVLLVCTPQTAPFAPSIEGGLGPCAPRFDPPAVLEWSAMGNAVARISAWLEQEPDPRARAVELTPGKKEMTAATLVAGQRSGARIYYLDHDTRHGLALYHTERLRLLTWAAAHDTG